jgi:hypothetical protein
LTVVSIIITACVLSLLTLHCYVNSLFTRLVLVASFILVMFAYNLAWNVVGSIWFEAVDSNSCVNST